MTLALQAMRVPFEEQIRLKEINVSSNPLLNRRKKVCIFLFYVLILIFLNKHKSKGQVIDLPLSLNYNEN